MWRLCEHTFVRWSNLTLDGDEQANSSACFESMQAGWLRHRAWAR